MNKALVILLLLQHCLFFASDHQITPSMSTEDFFRSILSWKKNPTCDWPTKVNRMLPKENDHIRINLQTNFNCCYYKTDNTHFPPIIIEKKDVLNLGFEKMHFLKDIQRTDSFSQKELSLIAELPDDLSNNLKNYFYSAYDHRYDFDSDYRIKFKYKKNITMRHVAKTIITCYKQLLPISAISLLYHHLYVQDLDNLWTKTQNQDLLQLNEKKALTNKLIDELKAQSKPGSELLEKMIISDVPFEDTFPEYAKDLYDGNILYGRIISGLITNIPAFYSYYYFAPKYYETRWTSDRRRERFFSSFIFRNLFILLQTHINSAITKVIFSHTIPQGLAGIAALVTVWGIIKAVIGSYKYHLKIIDFPRDKFKDKSTKEVLSYYLHKSTIQIV